MSATAKVFGSLLLILGVLLLIGGLAAAVAGSVDSQAAQDDCGAFGCDEERRMADQAAITAGATAAGLGFLFTVLGIALIVSGARQQQQQQQVVVDGGYVDAAAAGPTQSDEPGGYHDVVTQQGQSSQDGPRDNRRIGIVAVVAVVGVLLATVLVMGSVGSGPAESLFGESPTELLQDGSYQGQLQGSGRLGDVEGERHIEQIRLHDRADRVLLTFDWDPGQAGTDRLQVQVFKQNANGWTQVVDDVVAPGTTEEILGESRLDLSNAALRIEVGAADQTFILQQDFTVSYEVYDD